MNRLVISAPGSSCGKTTVTCAVLSAFKARGMESAAFKSGPDYIDPMFHRQISGVRSYNLDPFFLSSHELQRALAQRAGRDISIIEGAMGYYDGIGCTEQSSTYTVARATKTPVVLVADTRGCGNSIAAVLEGFKNYRADSGVSGVIFNGMSEKRYPDMARAALAVGVTPFGYLPFDKDNSVSSRHLGLVTAAEIDDLHEKLTRLGACAEKCIDLDGLIALGASASELSTVPEPDFRGTRVRVAVACDKAFCFIYKETLELLQALGGEIVPFSPLEDTGLPENCGGLYICGGYPELYLERLSANKEILAAIKSAVTGGMPTIAECGGFMLLHELLGGYHMTGVIPGSAYKTDKLQRFGYVTLTAREDNLLCEKGQSIKAHEFHYWDSEKPGNAFCAKKPGRDTAYDCALATDTLYAGFPHIHFTEKIVKRFLDRAETFAQNVQK